MASDPKELSNYIIDGNAQAAAKWADEALAGGMKATAIINQGLMPGMAEVGRRFKGGEYYLPEVIISARAMKAVMTKLQPLLTQSKAQRSGTVVIGTVQGDLHDIGKNLVGMMLEGAGYEVIDLGTDVPPEKFAQTAKEKKADIIGLSALLTTTMPMMKTTVAAVKKAGVKSRVMVGGAPVTEGYAKEIGADGYAPDAASAVDKAKFLMDIGAK